MGRPIFIIGTPRSGTTLLAKILNGHSQLFMPGETHYFQDIYAQRKQLGNLPNIEVAEKVFGRLSTLYGRYNEPVDQKRIEKILADAMLKQHLRSSMDSYRHALDKFMELQAEYERKPRWGNNVPKDLFHVDDILEFYPDAYFIVCVRDIRDFLKSYRSKWEITADTEVDRLKQLYHPVVTSLLWKASMRQVAVIRRKINKDRLIEVRYEELVSEPVTILYRICEFLGEAFEPGMLNINFSNSSDQKSQSGIYSASVASWKGRLSDEEVWIAQKIAGADLQVFGYIPDMVRPSPFHLMGLLLSMPWSLWKALRANRANTGPILPYLMRRVRGLVNR